MVAYFILSGDGILMFVADKSNAEKKAKAGPLTFPLSQ